MRLKDKVAVVTGGGAGIGRAIAIEFAREGAMVVIAELNESSGPVVANEIGDAGKFVPCDASSESSLAAAIDAATDAFGSFDIMVNNAGVSRRDWDTTIAVNLSGVYHGTRLAAERLAARGGGVIVNMASMLGLVGVGAEDGYVASKHGVIGLTKNYAIAYGARGVRVNCISPGWIETAMTAPIRAIEGIAQQMLAQTPLQRFGKPEEVAKAALFLASDESSYVTGTALVIDGGWTAR